MEIALYHPILGFYASGQTRTGRGGDFLTPVSPGPVLGELLARQVEELHDAMGRPPLLNLIEQGADAGWLARDLLLAIARNHPSLSPHIRMHLVEPHPVLERKQRQTLRASGLENSTRWHSSWGAFPQTKDPCLFYSCELVDSFPVKILRFREGGWQERWVGPEVARLGWQHRPATPESLAEIRRWQPPEIGEYTLELRPGAAPWVQGWTEKISCGMAVTLDYGFPATQFFSPARGAGTLVAIRHHQRIQDPLTDPGQVDLTAHVNFTELEELAAQAGFRNYGLTDFSRGLTALAAPWLKKESHLSESWIRNFRHLTHPSFFGQSHQILVQGKSLPASFFPSILMQV